MSASHTTALVSIARECIPGHNQARLWKCLCRLLWLQVTIEGHVMPQRAASAPITIRTAKVAEIDAVARAMGRSRNYIVNQAIEQYLEANVWQMGQIADGIEAACEARVLPAGEVFAELAAKHGWSG